MEQAGWALVIATSVLAVLTAWYAIETRRTVKRMDREREEMSRPVLTLQLIPWEATLIKLRIQNVGNGAASGVKGEMEAVTKAGLLSVPWSFPLLASGKYEEFGFPIPPDGKSDDRFRLDSVRERIPEVRAHFSYRSTYGTEYELEDSIDIREVTDDWLASRMMATQDHPDRLLPRIAKALESLAKNRPSK